MHHKSRKNAVKEKARIEKYITLRHWLAAIADRKQGFPIRHEGYTPREVYAKPQNV